MADLVLTLRELNSRRWLRARHVEDRAQGTATLVIEPFEPFEPRELRDALLEEGERLLRFVDDRAAAFEVRFADKT